MAGGVVTGVSEGVATITAAVDGKSATATIVVRAAAAPADGFTAVRVDVGALHTCALTDAGAAWCWGTNASGRLANGGNGPDGGESAVPLPVAGGYVFTQLTTGDSHTCGLTADGTAYCWGDNQSGRLGNGTADDTDEQDSEVPTAVAGGHTFAAISAGRGHTCGLTTDGTAYCWGDDTSGELGIGVVENRRLTPTAVATELEFTAISAGGGTTCALTAAGKAYCWGYNKDGQVGDGTTEMRLVPTAVAGGLTFKAIAASRWHLSCGLTPEGKLYCWGRDLVTGFNSPTPAPVASDLTFASFSVGFAHTCGVTGDGTAYCWGLNSTGQIGAGSAAQTVTVPTPVAGGLTFESVQGSWSYHTCGLTTDGVVHCWGLNSAGQLGDGTTTNRNAPVPVVRVEGN